jgi:hypothetical protein
MNSARSLPKVCMMAGDGELSENTHGGMYVCERKEEGREAVGSVESKISYWESTIHHERTSFTFCSFDPFNVSSSSSNFLLPPRRHGHCWR